MAEVKTIKFNGTGLQALGWGLLAALFSILIIPAAWGAVFLYRWLMRNLEFSDGCRAAFDGRGAEIWGYFAFASLIGFAPQLSRAFDDPSTSLFVLFALPILLLPLSAAVYLQIIRWFFSKIRLSSGTKLSFIGEYGAYLGWLLLVNLSVLTIIGWAWAVVAMQRWFYRNIEAGQSQLVFVGDGWGLLWRTFLGALACVFILPIPWVVLWIARWFIRNTLIQKEASL